MPNQNRGRYQAQLPARVPSARMGDGKIAAALTGALLVASGFPARAEIPCIAFTEIHYDPAAVPDQSGEWFEVTNYSVADPYDLGGLTIADDDGGSFTIEGSLTILPLTFLIFARSPDPDLNGGIAPDYIYGSAIALGNGGDVLAISREDTLIDGISYPPGASPPGASYSCRIGHRVLNNEPLRWYAATTPFGAGDRGTPGAPNEIYQPGPCDSGGGVSDHDPLDGRTQFLTLSPNPCQRGVWIDISPLLPGLTTLSVFDATGRVVARPQPRRGGRHYWDLRNSKGRRVPPAAYWVRGSGEQGETEIHKLVIIP